MSNSYDSVTPKRRPVVRAVLAVTAIIAIFGASVGAAQEVEPLVTSVGEASLTLSAPTTSLVAPPTTSSTTTSTTTTVPPVVESAVASGFVPEIDEFTALEIEASEDAVSFGSGEFVVGGASDEAAEAVDADTEEDAEVDTPQEDAPENDGSRQLQAAAPSEEVLELIAKIEEKDHQIAVLSEQLAYLRQAQLEDQIQPQESVSSSLTNKARLTRDENAAAMDLWRAGYTLGGGQNLPAFENTILPCESGSQPNPDTAVGRTDDWGRAQINRPVWKKRFESLTGKDFETGIVDPTLNGFMAAHVELEQGLRAWTCWRKR